MCGPGSGRSGTSGAASCSTCPTPRPDPGTPAPVRFLPEYDNVLLSHDDRSRFIRPEHKAGAADAFAGSTGSVLHDGTVRGAWRLDRDKASGTAARPPPRHPGPRPRRR